MPKFALYFNRTEGAELEGIFDTVEECLHITSTSTGISDILPQVITNNEQHGRIEVWLGDFRIAIIEEEIEESNNDA